MKQLTRKLIAGAASAAFVASSILPGVAFGANVTSEDLFGGVGASGAGSVQIAEALGANPTQNLTLTVARIIRQFLGLLGIVAVVIVVWGGFEWMTAGGAEENVGKAKQRILQGVIGLALILSAFAVAQFVVTSLTKAVTGVP